MQFTFSIGGRHQPMNPIFMGSNNGVIMRQRLVRPLTVIAILAMVAAGCSKEDSSTTEPEQTAPTPPNISFKGPTTSSTDINPQKVKSMVASFNAYSVALSPYSALPAVQKGNVWTWTYTQGTFSITFTGTAQADGTNAWKMVMNGPDPSSGVTYNNWTRIEGTSSANGQNGSFKAFDTNSTNQTGEFTWSTVNNILTGIQKAIDQSVMIARVVVINNPNGTGEVTTYTGTTLAYHAVWQANGSGEWWSYDQNGQQNGTGIWN
jgi:hypothetical protein